MPTGANTFGRRATPVTVAPEMVRGQQMFRVRFRDPQSNRIVRRFFHGRKAAAAFALKMQNVNRDALATFAALDSSAQAHLMAVWREAEARGVDLMAAVLAAQGKAKPMALRKAIERFIGSKRAANLDAGYLDELELLLWRFARGREELPLSGVSTDLVAGFIQEAAMESRSTRRARLANFLNFCVRQGWLPLNPCSKLERVKLVRAPVRVFAENELRECLKFIRSKVPRLGPWFVLSTLCGLRPEEAEKTTRREINFSEGWVRVEAQSSKVRLRRVVYPMPSAVAALKRAVAGHKPIALTRDSRIKGLQRLRRYLGWDKWPQDVTRHTAASIWLALEPDVQRVAGMLGNSPAVLLSHYKAVMTRKEAERLLEVFRQGI